MYHYLLKTANLSFFHILLALLLATIVTFSPVFSSLAAAEEISENPSETTTEQTDPEPTEVTEDPEPPEETSGETDIATSEETETDTKSEEQPEDSVIVTGDAEAVSETESFVNTTETETQTEDPEESSGSKENIGTSSPQETDTVATGTPQTATTTTDIDQASSTPPNTTTKPATIDNQNNATSTTQGTTTASTGGNSAAANNTAHIETGDAVAVANILNVVNTNIINSDGLVSFMNDVLGFTDFKLTSIFENVFKNTTALSTPSCSLTVCNNDSVTTHVTNQNNAVINNNIYVEAHTGDNTTSADTATIATGNALAAANLMNIANTNIVDSNYLLLSFNNLSDYDGDIVLPNNSFFDDLFRGCSQTANATVNNTNEAQITNQVSVDAHTGNNQATGSNAFIFSGDATAGASVHNQTNQNLTCGDSFTMVVKVHGDWDGDIEGLPEGFSWKETSDGITIYSEQNPDGTGEPLENILLNNSNAASIHNNVHVLALTGDNKAAGTEVAGIATGDARAQANILNIANTNVVGQNWATLIFNIYGNWSGNLSFGQPDLWLGIKANTSGAKYMPESPVSYNMTIMNHGDTTAPDVSLHTLFEKSKLSFADAFTSEIDETLGELTIMVGDIAPGETKEITVPGAISGGLPQYEKTNIPLFASVQSTRSDANDADNTDVVNIVAGTAKPKIDKRYTLPPKLEITKEANVSNIGPGQNVDYTITVFNNGGPAYEAVLKDVLTNPDDEMVGEQYWELDTIGTWEEVQITYTTAFGSSASGTYTNTAQVLAKSGRSSHLGTPYLSPAASHDVHVGTQPEPAVLGMSIDQCPQYLTSYLRHGKPNNRAEVTKLQLFLNEDLGTNLQASGKFGTATEAAVRAFQNKYASDVLDPWGLPQNTGYVYYTTQKKINELYCQNSMDFPLNNTQVAEITAFKKRFGFMSDTPVPLEESDGDAELIPLVGARDLEPATAEIDRLSNRNTSSTQISHTNPWYWKTATFIGTQLRTWLGSIAEASESQD